MLATLASVQCMIPVAASTSAARPVPGETWRVLGAFPTAVYLGGPGRSVLPVVASDGLLLPNAWRLALPAADVLWGVALGDPVEVRVDGSVCVGVLAMGPRMVARTNDAVRPGNHPRTHEGGIILRPVRAWAPRAVARARPQTLRLDRDHLVARIGHGPGLTPEGDDEVCGALLIAHALGDRTLWHSVAPLVARTTDLSAALLRCAGDGLAVPELTAFVDAVVADDADLAGRLRPAVLAIGHSSGPALVRGVEEAFAALTEGELLRA